MSMWTKECANETITYRVDALGAWQKIKESDRYRKVDSIGKQNPADLERRGYKRIY